MSDFLERVRAYEGRVIGPPSVALDAVNAAMIRHWCDAVGDTNPIYVDDAAARAAGHDGIVAPPTMLQAWSMRGLGGRTGATEQDALFRELDAAGFTSVVATNSDQEYFRYLRPGDVITTTTTIESISEEKTTALGVGHFVTTLQEYRDQDGELVGTMRFRMLKFAPRPAAPARPRRPRPAITHDNAFWYDGVNEGKLLIQRCAACGKLRHPPGPMCPACHSLEWDTVESAGRGTVYSFVVNHYPQVPAFDYPLVVAVIALDEGTRLVSNLVGVDPADVTIGMAVECEMVQFDDELTLPQFHPVEAS
ncbi:MAG TPA: bifunctional MaoC family dehydratase N-terminal/OB-fold nucleic acid binding domain-containing protein [Acidimicrobiales bacterium]|nr:bifunctional MaoC family dehydratase N-terminal/OB-fold nucleic acid binding domain-containing protein [Acidimicrobiales bacterium]